MNYFIEFSDETTDLMQTVKIKRVNQGVVESEGSMSMHHFIELLNSSVNQNIEDNIETPILPKNCLKFVWRNMAEQTADVFIEVESSQFNIQLFEKLYVLVGFPRMIVKYHVQKNEVTFGGIYAVLNDGKPITNDTPLYQFPYTHVGSDGRVCMGRNVLPSLNGDFQSLERYHMYFINSPFSGDYGAKSMLNLPITELIESAENKPFNDEWLVPAFTYQKVHLTFSSLMKYNK